MPTGTGSQDRCCHRAAGRKRYSGTVIIVFATIATIAMTIVAIAASAVPLYSAFGWINVILNVTVLDSSSPRRSSIRRPANRIGERARAEYTPPPSCTSPLLLSSIVPP